MGVIRKVEEEAPKKKKRNTDDHTKLVEIAEKWLYAKGCNFVIKELTSRAQEVPDAIGFVDGVSILVECKVSRSDFKRDAKKVL